MQQYIQQQQSKVEQANKAFKRTIHIFTISLAISYDMTNITNTVKKLMQFTNTNTPDFVEKQRKF